MIYHFPRDFIPGYYILSLRDFRRYFIFLIAIAALCPCQIARSQCSRQYPARFIVLLPRATPDGLVFPMHRVMYPRMASGRPLRVFSVMEGWIDEVIVS